MTNRINEEMLQKFIIFIQKCNTESIGGSDHSIINAVFKNIAADTFLTIDELANDANTSKTSITRFIQRNNFNNYYEFKSLMSSGAKLLYQNLELEFLKSYGNNSYYEEISDSTFDDILENLLETKKKLDIKKIIEIIRTLKQHKEVTFIGNEHDLDEFHMLQLTMLTAGIPSYFFKTDQTRNIHSNFFSNQSVVVFINVADKFFRFNEILDQAIKQNSKIIYISQDSNDEIKDICDIYYQYGIPNSINNGYVSLMYIARVMFKFFIKVRLNEI